MAILAALCNYNYLALRISDVGILHSDVQHVFLEVPKGLINQRRVGKKELKVFEEKTHLVKMCIPAPPWMIKVVRNS